MLCTGTLSTVRLLSCWVLLFGGWRRKPNISVQVLSTASDNRGPCYCLAPPRRRCLNACDTMNFHETLNNLYHSTKTNASRQRRRAEESSQIRSNITMNGEKARLTRMKDTGFFAHGNLNQRVLRIQWKPQQQHHSYRFKTSWFGGLLILTSIFSRHTCYAHPQQSRCFAEFASADKNNDHVFDSSEYVAALKALSDDRLFHDVANLDDLPHTLKEKFYDINTSAGTKYNNNADVHDSESRKKSATWSPKREKLKKACSEIYEEIDFLIATQFDPLSNTIPQTPSAVEEDAIHLRQRILEDSTPAPTPSLQQCRIGALLSDRNRNDYIDQTEYVIFINRMSEDHWEDVTSFDGLPALLRENYLTLAGSKVETGIYILGARQSDDADDEQQLFLERICSDTSLAINEAIFGEVQPTNPPTKAPTSAPTPLSTKVEPTQAPSSRPQITLPQCFAAMSSSDRSPRDSKISSTEYPLFVNVLSKRVLSYTSFDELPLLLKVNFASLADELSMIDIYGSRRNENASPEQQEYLELVCEKTFEAVIIVLNPTPTDPPVTATAAPSVYPSVTPTLKPVAEIEPSSSPSISPTIRPTAQPDTPSISPSPPTGITVLVSSTFLISNTAGLTAGDLQSGQDRNDLEAAYGTTVESTVANKEPPGQGDATYVPSSGVLESIEDIECPPNVDQGTLCQGVRATFEIITNEDNGSVVEFVYANAVHEEIDNGTLQTNLDNINAATPIDIIEGFRIGFTTTPSVSPSIAPSVAPSISSAPSPTTETASPSFAPSATPKPSAGKFTGDLRVVANFVAKNTQGLKADSFEPETPNRSQLALTYDITANTVTNEYDSRESKSRSLRVRYSSHRRLEVSFNSSTIEEIVDAEACPSVTDSEATCLNVYAHFDVIVTDEDKEKVRFELAEAMKSAIDDGTFQSVLDGINPDHPLTIIEGVQPPDRESTPAPVPKSDDNGMSVLIIVGIAVAGTLGLAALGGTFAYVWGRKASKQGQRLDDIDVEDVDLIDDNNAPTMDLIEESQNDPFKDNTIFPDVFQEKIDPGSEESPPAPVPVAVKKDDKRRTEVNKYDKEDFDKYDKDEGSAGSLEDFPARESVTNAFSLGDDSQSDFNEYNFDDYSEGDLEQAQKLAGKRTTEEELQQARRLGGVDYSDSSSEGQSGWSTGDVNSSPDKSSTADKEPEDDSINLGTAAGATAVGGALAVGAIAAMGNSDSESEESMISDEGDSEVSDADSSMVSDEEESSQGESEESSQETSVVSNEVSDEEESEESGEESEESDQEGSSVSEQEDSEDSEQEGSEVTDEEESSGSEEEVSVKSEEQDSILSNKEEVVMSEHETPKEESVRASSEEQSFVSTPSAPVDDGLPKTQERAVSPVGETAVAASSAPSSSGDKKGPNVGLIAGTTAAAAAVTGAAIAIAKTKRESDSDSKVSGSSGSVSEGEKKASSAHSSEHKSNASGAERQPEDVHTRDTGVAVRAPDGGDDGPNPGLIAGATVAAAATAAGLVAVTRASSSNEGDSESDSAEEGNEEESDSDDEGDRQRADTYLPTPYQDREDDDEGSDELSFTESDTDTSTIESSTAELTPEEAQRRAEYRSEVEALVGTVVPDEIDNVDVMMVQFRGREAELVSTLRTMQERSVTQRARAAVHKSSKRPTRRLSRGPGSWRGNSPFSRESASSDSRGSAAGSAVIAAASVPRVTAGRPPVHMPPMPGAEREGSKASSDFSDPVFAQKQAGFQPKSFASRLGQGDEDGDEEKSESSGSDYVPPRLDSSGSSSGSGSDSSYISESEEGGGGGGGEVYDQGADPPVDRNRRDSRSREPAMTQSTHSKSAESLGIEDLPSRWSGMPS